MCSARLATDADGNVIFADGYQPFGQDNGTPQGSETYRFTGKPVSTTTGLYYEYQRWYDPSTGRFISQDPLPGYASLPQSQNPYVYVVNQPTRLTDPSGASFLWQGCGGGERCGGAGGSYTSSITTENLPQVSIETTPASEDLVNTANFWKNAENTGIGTRDLVSTTSFWDEAEANLRFPAATGTQGSGYKFVSTPNGYLVRIPANWESRIANNGRGLVVQDPAVDPASNVNMIRIMDPTMRYPQGYVVYYNEFEQPLDVYGQPGGRDVTHIPLTYQGPIPGWP